VFPKPLEDKHTAS